MLCEDKGVRPSTVLLATPAQELHEKGPDGKPLKALMAISIVTAKDFKDRQQLVQEKFTHFYKWTKEEDTAATAAQPNPAQPSTGHAQPAEKIYK